MNRLVGLDLLRLFSFQFICHYHFITMLWEDDPLGFEFIRRESAFFIPYFKIHEFFWYSGWTVIAISSFLLGLRAGKGRGISNRLIAILLIAWPIMCFAFYGFQKFELYWDVYPLLAVSFIVCNFITYLKPSISQLKVLSLLFMALFFLTQSYDFLIADNAFLNSVLWGGCSHSDSGFPLFPFMFFILFFFVIGKLYERSELMWLSRPVYPGVELVFWVSLLFISLFQYKQSVSMLHIAYLKEECYAADFSITTFWSAFIWPVAFMRLILVEKVSAFVGKHFGFLQKLYINKMFGVTYFASFLILGTLAGFFGSILRENQYAYALVIILLYPMIELFMYSMDVLFRKLKSISGS